MQSTQIPSNFLTNMFELQGPLHPGWKQLLKLSYFNICDECCLELNLNIRHYLNKSRTSLVPFYTIVGSYLQTWERLCLVQDL